MWNPAHVSEPRNTYFTLKQDGIELYSCFDASTLRSSYRTEVLRINKREERERARGGEGSPSSGE